MTRVGSTGAVLPGSTRSHWAGEQLFPGALRPSKSPGPGLTLEAKPSSNFTEVWAV